MSPEVGRDHLLDERLQTEVVICHTFGFMDSLHQTHTHTHTNTHTHKQTLVCVPVIAACWPEVLETLKAVKTFSGEKNKEGVQYDFLLCFFTSYLQKNQRSH